MNFEIRGRSPLRPRAARLALARELTPVTLRELSVAFGLTHPDSVRNLIRRADRALLGSRPLPAEIEAIRHRLPKTGPDRAKPPAEVVGRRVIAGDTKSLIFVLCY